MEKQIIFFTQNVSRHMLQNIQESFSTAHSCLLHNFLQFILNYSTLLSTRNKSDPIFCPLQQYFCPSILFQTTSDPQFLKIF